MENITRWLSNDEVKSIFSSTFWNDVEIEMHKDWWIDDQNPKSSTDYLATSGLLDEYQFAEKLIASDTRNAEKEVLDLAAGVGWTSSLLSKLNSVRQVHAVEISEHRLGELFEKWCKLLDGNGQKIKRYLGSFYDLKFPNESIDLVFMSQAFHHANNPLRLLLECDRVLKKGGQIVLVGEHHITHLMLLRRFFGNLLKRHKFSTNFYELFPPEPVGGDHYYRITDYYFMFNSIGYSLEHFPHRKSHNLVFLAKKI